MKRLASILFVSSLYLVACNNVADKNGYDHDDGTHAHEDEAHGHEHGEGSHQHDEKHEQEDFVVGEDATEQDSAVTEEHTHSHEDGHGHSHDH